MTDPHLRSLELCADRRRETAILFACVLALCGTQVLGQTPDPSSPPPEDEPITMSPFEVRADLDTGYLASTAQSGTRLRTELKDVASSIQVVTKDFLNDIGAKDLGGLLVYTLGTEVNGTRGNFSDAGLIDNPNGKEADYDEAFSSASPSTRVRGLTTADLSRDFFITGIPMDAFNIERVEISRGPNAMLFGLGSPSGIINYSLAKADLRRRKTTVEVRTDQYGSFRGELDHNQVLIKDKLAIRLASVYEDEDYKIEEAWRRNKRVYLAATFRPFKNTTLRVNTEHGEISSNMPEVRPPFDAYTQWWLMGRPAWDPSTGTGFLLGTPAPGWPTTVFNANGTSASTGGPTPVGTTTLNSTNLFSGQNGAIGAGSHQMVIVYNDPTSSTPSLGLADPSVIGFRSGNYDRLKQNPNGSFVAGTLAQTRGVRDWAYILNRVLHYSEISYNFWKSQQITDPQLFDFYHHMLHGPNKHEWAEFNTYNATLEQTFLNGDAGIELAFNRDNLDNGATLDLDSTISGYTLRVDMNYKLGNGALNPNFGRPFTTAYSKASVRSYDRDTYRGTAYYNLDLRRSGPTWLGKLLGQHRFTGTYTAFENQALLENNDFAFASGVDYALKDFGTVAALNNGRRGLPIMRYLGPDVSASPTPALGVFAVPTNQWPDFDTARILYYNTPPTTTTVPGTWTVNDFSILRAGERDVDKVRNRITFTKEKVESVVGIAQSYWLEGNLVSTLGWRRDEVRSYDAGTPEIDPSTGLAVFDKNFYPREVSTQSESSFNYGIVAHSPEFINRHLPLGTRVSLIYNHADNFRPAGQRYDFFDNPIPAETGETKEYGVALSTLNGRLVLKATKYETTSGLSSSLLSSLTTPKNNLVNMLADVQEENLRGGNSGNSAGLAAWNEWYNGPIGSALRKTFRFTNDTQPSTNPDISTNNRGTQVVSTADVTSKGEEYEIVFNPTPNWRIGFNASRAEAVRTNVGAQLRDLVFNSLDPLMKGPAGQLFYAENNATPVRDRFILQVYNQILPEIANEGSPTTELREWHWNLITNYSFTRGPLKGFNVGGGVRWLDKIATGFPIINDPVLGIVPDVHHPFYGAAETYYDAHLGYTRKFQKFTWKVQLYVHNIGVGNELIPVAAQPDGSIANWRIAPAQSWTLSNTFSF